MIELAWIVSVCLSLYIGYLYRDIRDKVNSFKISLEKKVEKTPTEETKSSVIDALDPIQQAKFEHARLMKRMNPGSDE